MAPSRSGGADHGDRRNRCVRRRPTLSRGGGEEPTVPAAEFGSYYGRPVIKKPVWAWDIAAYFATGGIMAGSSLLAAGADVTGNTRLRRTTRLTAVANLGASTYFLVHDLGRPDRFYNMLRVVKPTSPMSIGSWVLAAYAAPTALAAVVELIGILPGAGRAAGFGAAAIAPVVASYTAVLTADTAVPAWHDAYPYLPFVFVGSAGAAASGLAMVLVPPAMAGPAR
ncbi:MAG TPA: NrfD/PsrC family molybdoenzyme membrane anchor subunit, partial [Acidimicrobiales bacterium]|nr:NrfD/PsrC family molybdoenzyme membrane anchor subunit [Acidimicrobiales bacterium]